MMKQLTQVRSGRSALHPLKDSAYPPETISIAWKIDGKQMEHQPTNGKPTQTLRKTYGNPWKTEGAPMEIRNHRKHMANPMEHRWQQTENV